MISNIELISEKWQLVYKLGVIYWDQHLYQSAERIYRWAFIKVCIKLHREYPKTLEIVGDLA